MHEGNNLYKVIKIGSQKRLNERYSCGKYMKPWHSIKDQTEKECGEGDEDAASEADAAQGGRM